VPVGRADRLAAATLRPVGVRQTRVCIETFYTPRNGLYAVLNALMARRRFRAIVDELL